MTEDRHLAQFNMARLKHQPDDPRVAGFFSGVERMHALAERSPGFVWRLSDEPTRARPSGGFSDFADPRLYVTLSVWETLDAFRDFVWRSAHRTFIDRRADWFEPHDSPYLVMWHLPVGERPTLPAGLARLKFLIRKGPSANAFGWDGPPAN